MEQLYSVRDVSKIFGVQEARLRYWAQTGFVNPSVRKSGRTFYTFQDLIGVRMAKELLDSGLTLQRVRKNLDALRSQLPADRALSALRVCSDGDRVVVVEGDRAYQPESGQVVMDFTVESLSSQVSELLELPTTRARTAPALARVDQSAYRAFVDGCGAEAAGDLDRAEACYRRAVQRDPALSAAYTNLGNLLHRRGELAEARAAYERALEQEPEQVEARFNLGNVLDDLGETDLAIAELRHVCGRCPEFADAHYNLGMILARVGGVAQARTHFEKYLSLDPDSEWAAKARAWLG